MNIYQKEADLLFSQLKYDTDYIAKLEKEHGRCIKLSQTKKANVYLFSDGFEVKIFSHYRPFMPRT